MQVKESTYLTVPWGINKGKEQTDIFLQELSMNQINNKKGRTKNFRTKYRQTLLAYVTVLCKKISVCVLSGYKRKAAKGSMTVEAAFVLPFCLYAMVNLMSIMELYRLQGNLSAAMHNTAKDMAVYAHSIENNSTALNATYAGIKTESELGEKYLNHSPVTGGAMGILWLQSRFLQEDECIDLVASYHVGPTFRLMGYSGFAMYNRTRTRAWTGYDNAGAAGNGRNEEQLVYITPSGSAYHLSKNCSYLKLSIQGVDKDIVGELRNKDGSIYYACDDCGNRDSSRVFVTDYGNRYHTTLQCSGLKRTIYLVPISQAQGRTPCSKCN
ncbi:MAG: hypothetical protein DBY13_07070 [Lachnospiraceae bacterium]|nr:MAG: hypothetical protein DBY13_07070 [Lachnospiraceae bacterium]